MRKLSAVLLTLLFLLPVGVQADEKIRGKYEVIGDISRLKNVKTIEVIEFFNYSCGHCYRFLEASKRLHSKFKDKLHHKKFPILGIMWHPERKSMTSHEIELMNIFYENIFWRK